jgi:Domain of unknown function (DUF4397)
MFRLLKARLLASALAALSLLNVGCTTTSLTQVRFVHAIEDADALDIDINGTKEFTDIAFTNVMPASGYKSAASGLVTIEGFLTGTSTEAFSTSNVGLVNGNQYTVVATGFVTNTNDVVIIAPVDHNTPPADGTVNFRVINASPSSPTTVDIYILKAQDQTLSPPATISGLAYQATSNYINVPYNSAGSGYIIYVCQPGTTTQIFNQSISVGGPNEGSVRTLILTAQPNLDQMNPRFVILDDFN